MKYDVIINIKTVKEFLLVCKIYDFKPWSMIEINQTIKKRAICIYTDEQNRKVDVDYDFMDLCHLNNYNVIDIKQLIIREKLRIKKNKLPK